jgi:hypothetical protein
MNPFCAKNFKTNYNVTPYGDHGTERVKLIALLVLGIFPLQHSIAKMKRKIHFKM